MVTNCLESSRLVRVWGSIPQRPALTYFIGDLDMKNIILEIHAGEGGTDSKLFIYDLAAAYVKFARNNGVDS